MGLGLRFRAWASAIDLGAGYRVYGLGFRVYNLSFGIRSLRFAFKGLGFMVQCLRVKGSGV